MSKSHEEQLRELRKKNSYILHSLQEANELNTILRIEKNNWIQEYEKALEGACNTRFQMNSIANNFDQSKMLKEHFNDLDKSANISRIPHVLQDQEDYSRLDLDIFKKNFEKDVFENRKLDKKLIDASQSYEEKRKLLDNLQKKTQEMEDQISIWSEKFLSHTILYHEKMSQVIKKQASIKSEEFSGINNNNNLDSKSYQQATIKKPEVSEAQSLLKTNSILKDEIESLKLRLGDAEKRYSNANLEYTRFKTHWQFNSSFTINCESQSELEKKYNSDYKEYNINSSANVNSRSNYNSKNFDRTKSNTITPNNTCHIVPEERDETESSIDNDLKLELRELKNLLFEKQSEFQNLKEEFECISNDKTFLLEQVKNLDSKIKEKYFNDNDTSMQQNEFIKDYASTFKDWNFSFTIDKNNAISDQNSMFGNEKLTFNQKMIDNCKVVTSDNTRNLIKNDVRDSLHMDSLNFKTEMIYFTETINTQNSKLDKQQRDLEQTIGNCESLKSERDSLKEKWINTEESQENLQEENDKMIRDIFDLKHDNLKLRSQTTERNSSNKKNNGLMIDELFKNNQILNKEKDGLETLVQEKNNEIELLLINQNETQQELDSIKNSFGKYKLEKDSGITDPYENHTEVQKEKSAMENELYLLNENYKRIQEENMQLWNDKEKMETCYKNEIASTKIEMKNNRKAMVEELEIAKSEYSISVQKKKSLKKQIHEKNTELVQVKEELGYEKSSNESLNNDILNVKKEKFELQRMFDSIIKDFNEKKIDNRRFKDDILEKNLIIKEKEMIIADLQMSTEIQNRKYEMAKNIIDIAHNLEQDMTSTESLNRLKGEVNIIEKELEEVRVEKKMYQNEISALNLEVKQNNSLMCEYQDQITKLQQQMLSLEYEISSLKSKNKNKEDMHVLQNCIITQKLEDWVEENGDKIYAKCQSEQALSNFDNSISEKSWDNKEANSEIIFPIYKTNQNKLAMINKDKIVELINDIKILNSLYKDQSVVLNQFKKENQTLNQSIQILEENVKSSELERGFLKKKVERYEESSANIMTFRGQTSSELKDKNILETINPTAVESLLEEQREEIQIMKQEIISLESQKKVLMKELGETQSDIIQLKNEDFQPSKEIKRLQELIFEKDSKIQNYFTLYNESTDNNNNKVLRYQEEIEENLYKIQSLEAYIKKIEKESQDNKNNRETFSTNYETLKKDKDYITQELEKYLKEKGYLEKTVKEKCFELEIKNNEIIDYNEKQAILINENEMLKTQLEQISRSKDLNKSKLSELEDENQNLKFQMEQIDNNFVLASGEYDQDIVVMKKDNSKLVDKVQDLTTKVNQLEMYNTLIKTELDKKNSDSLQNTQSIKKSEKNTAESSITTSQQTFDNNCQNFSSKQSSKKPNGVKSIKSEIQAISKVDDENYISKEHVKELNDENYLLKQQIKRLKSSRQKEKHFVESSTVSRDSENSLHDTEQNYVIEDFITTFGNNEQRINKSEKNTNKGRRTKDSNKLFVSKKEKMTREIDYESENKELKITIENTMKRLSESKKKTDELDNENQCQKEKINMLNNKLDDFQVEQISFEKEKSKIIKLNSNNKETLIANDCYKKQIKEIRAQRDALKKQRDCQEKEKTEIDSELTFVGFEKEKLANDTLELKAKVIRLETLLQYTDINDGKMFESKIQSLEKDMINMKEKYNFEKKQKDKLLDQLNSLKASFDGKHKEIEKLRFNLEKASTAYLDKTCINSSRHQRHSSASFTFTAPIEKDFMQTAEGDQSSIKLDTPVNFVDKKQSTVKKAGSIMSEKSKSIVYLEDKLNNMTSDMLSVENLQLRDNTVDSHRNFVKYVIKSLNDARCQLKQAVESKGGYDYLKIKATFMAVDNILTKVSNKFKLHQCKENELLKSNSKCNEPLDSFRDTTSYKARYEAQLSLTPNQFRMSVDNQKLCINTPTRSSKTPNYNKYAQNQQKSTEQVHAKKCAKLPKNLIDRAKKLNSNITVNKYDIHHNIECNSPKFDISTDRLMEQIGEILNKDSDKIKILSNRNKENSYNNQINSLPNSKSSRIQSNESDILNDKKIKTIVSKLSIYKKKMLELKEFYKLIDNIVEEILKKRKDLQNSSVNKQLSELKKTSTIDEISNKIQIVKDNESKINDKFMNDFNSHIKCLKIEVDGLSKDCEKRKALLTTIMTEVDYSAEEHGVFRSLISNT